MADLSYLVFNGKKLDIADETARKSVETSKTEMQENLKTHSETVADKSTLAHVTLSDSVTESSDVTGGKAATPLAVKTAHDKACNAQTIAERKVQARHFNTTEELKAWLSDPANIGVASIGDHLYTMDHNEPDWWIEAVRGNPNPEGFYYDIKKIGADAMVIMYEFVPVEERVKGSLYLQLGKTRGLIVKVFKKFFNREYMSSDTSDTLTFKQTTAKTTNVNDGNKYRFLCKNLSILEDGDTTERLEGKIYFVAK